MNKIIVLFTVAKMGRLLQQVAAPLPPACPFLELLRSNALCYPYIPEPVSDDAVQTFVWWQLWQLLGKHRPCTDRQTDRTPCASTPQTSLSLQVTHVS